MFGNGELFSIYKTNFVMFHNFQYDMEWFENLTPYEREIYTLMLMDHLEKEKVRRQKNGG